MRSSPHGAPAEAWASLPHMSLLPMLLSRCDTGAFDDPAYAFELKYDGVRMLARKAGGTVMLCNRRGNDRTFVYTEIADELSLIAPDVVLDGEVIALDGEARPDFYNVMRRDRQAFPDKRQLAAIPCYFMAFDILFCAGSDLCGVAFAKRREILEQVLEGAQGLGCIMPTDIFLGQGRAVFDAACGMNLEGIVAKRLDSIYRPGRRTSDWLKIKNPHYTR